MTQMADLMYQNYHTEGDALIFNPTRFKEKILPTIEREFDGYRIMPKSKELIADDLVDLIAVQTTDDIDGANDIIQNAFNRLYCSPAKVSLVDKKQHFNTLVSRFEVFLKKVYYLKNHTEILSTRPGQEGMRATLADCIFQTPCLKRLKYSDDDSDKKFCLYLDLVRDWRNDNAHKAPIGNEQEYDKAINVLTSMYLYVVAFAIRHRDISPVSMSKSSDINEEPYSIAAEPSE